MPRRCSLRGMLALLAVILLIGLLVLLVGFLVVILVVVLLAALRIVLIAIVLVFLIHDTVPPEPFVGYRIDSMTAFSGFIPGTKDYSSQQCEKHSSADPASGGFQTANKNAKRSFFVYGFPDPFGQRVAEPCQGNGSACTAPVNQGLV